MKEKNFILIKNTFKKTRNYFILNGERLKYLPPKTGNSTRLSINKMLEVLQKLLQQRPERKQKAYRSERKK